MKSPLLKKTIFLFTVIFLFNSCCKDDDASSINQGKVNIYIEGDITNEEAAAKLEAEIGILTENIYIQETTHLTSLTISLNYELRSIIFKDSNINLSEIIIHGKEKINELKIENSYKDSNILIDGFTSADKILIKTQNNNNTNKLTNIICNDLKQVNHFISLFASYSRDNSVLFSDLEIAGKFNSSVYWNNWSGKFIEFDFPLLKEVYNLNMSYNYDNYYNTSGIGIIKNTLTFPNLEKINYLYFFSDSFVTSYNFPKLKTCVNFEASFNTGSLGETFYTDELFNMPLLDYCQNFRLGILNFNSINVNSYLNKFLTIQPLTGKRIELYGSPPTGQGLIDKQTLINLGNIVNTN
jgi:hypothetical protein